MVNAMVASHELEHEAALTTLWIVNAGGEVIVTGTSVSHPEATSVILTV